MPALTHVNLRFAGQFKDRVIDYMLERDLKVKHLQLDAANLVSDQRWQQVFQKLGSQLETLRLSNMDFSLDDETIQVMSKSCTGLRRLKLEDCWKMSDRSLRAIANIQSLEYLSLNLISETQPENLLELVSKIGSNLRTLSLRGFALADDTVLEMIHDKCKFLTKLRFTDNSICTDKGFVKLFDNWSNPPLEFADFSSTRDVDNSNPDGPTDATGLASNGFAALMRHSGSTLRKLNISSCRHISYAAFDDVFADGKSYPLLKELDVSFQTVMDDYLVGRIFRCCPAIQKIVAFACFNVRDARVPRGVALIGGLRSQDTLA
jgi:DNA repair protein RAD7